MTKPQKQMKENWKICENHLFN